MASIDEDPSTVLSRLYEQIIADEKRYAEGKAQGPSKEWPKPKSGKPRPRPSIDLVGLTYGRLTVLEVIEDGPPPAQYHLKPKKYRARYACGREVSVGGGK